MKRTIALMLSLVMMFSFTACGGSNDQAATSAASESSATEEKAETKELGTVILMEKDDDMKNTYTAIAVNPEAPFVDANGTAVSDVAINTAGADALMHWLLSEEALAMAADFGYDDYGEYLFYRQDDAPVYDGEIAKATEDTKTIRLSTTTSVNDSGLLAELLPVFEQKYGYTVEVTSDGTGKAIAAAENGNADLILVHAKDKEEEFVQKGFGRVVDGFDSERVSFLYNYFVLCGPKDDPAGVKDAASVKDAFAAIAEQKAPFISRGDGSGTHTKELTLWPESLGITEDAASFEQYKDWYTSANAGMGACLVMAEEQGAYILTDKATFLTFQANGGQIEK